LIRPKIAALTRRRLELKAETEDQFGELEQGLKEYPGGYSDKDRETDETDVEAAACQPMTSKPTAKHRMLPKLCRQHNRFNCPQCLNISAPAHRCQAVIANCQDCGQHHPAVADACQSQDKSSRMPVTEGTIEGQRASVLRDTGCFTVVVRRSLVPDDKITDQVETCVFTDGTVRRTLVAEIRVDTPYFSGPTMAMCMDNPVYDLVVGNVEGATEPVFSP